MPGAGINADVIKEESPGAVEGHFGPFSAAAEATVAQICLGHRRHGLNDGQKSTGIRPVATVEREEGFGGVGSVGPWDWSTTARTGQP